MTGIENSAFQNCVGLTEVDLRNGLEIIDYAAFYGCSSLKSITIPDSLDVLGYGAFYRCTDLTSVTFGSNVTSIGALTFYGCWSLTNVSVPDSVSSIGYGAFFDCKDISSVIIGTGVTNIGSSAFGNCSSLISIDFESIAPSLANDWIVDHNSDLTIHYRPGASGFTSPSWQGVPTELNGTTLAAPQVIGVRSGSGSVEISWNALTGNGSEGIDFYIIYQDGEDVMHVASGTTANISGLVNGHTYTFRIAAHDSDGAGLRSTSFRVVPYTSPGTLSVTIMAPTESSFLKSGDVNVTWIIGGEVSNVSYSEIRVDDVTPVLLSATDLSYRFQGLSEGSHTVNVTLVDVQNSLIFARVTFTVDTTAPTVIEFSPTGNGTSTRTSVVVKFSEDMDKTVTGIVLEGIAGIVSWNGSIATFIPSSTLIGNTTYTVTLNGEDMSGNALPITNWTFTTANVGKISGKILDANDFPIVNATVTLTRASSVLSGIDNPTADESNISLTTWETETDAHGNYAFYDMAPGNYTLTSIKAGYDKTTANIALTIPGIAVGGLTFDERIIPQASGGNDSNMGLIIVFIMVVVLILLAFVWSRRKK